MDMKNKLSVLFEKPVSLLFALVNIFPFSLFLANILRGGKESILSSSFRDVSERTDTQQAIQQAAQGFIQQITQEASEQATQQATQQAAQQVTPIATQQATEIAQQALAAQQAAEATAQLATEQAAQIIAQPTTQQVIQQVVQQASEQAAVQAAEQAAQLARPTVQEAAFLAAREATQQLVDQINSRPVPAMFLLLAVLLAMGIGGIHYWYKKRLAVDVGNKFIPNITSFIEVLGKWFAGWVAISSLLFVLIISVFRTAHLLDALGLHRVAHNMGWNLAFMGLVRGLVILIATKIILYLISVRWKVWNFFWQKIVLSCTAWSGGLIKKFSMEQGARMFICFTSIVLLFMGVWLVHKGINDPVIPKAVSTVTSRASSISMEKVSGGNIPDALTGIDSQMDFKGANRREAPEQTGFSITNEAQGAEGSALRPKINHLIYAGLLSILLCLAALGFLIIRKSPQYS